MAGLCLWPAFFTLSIIFTAQSKFLKLVACPYPLLIPHKSGADMVVALF